MPIKPVSGEIKAQVLNDNFSLLDSKTNNINKGAPSGTYATLAELKAKYPSGNNNMYVVTADGKWYYWSGTDWVAGGVYQSQGLADDSVTSGIIKKGTIIHTNLADKDVVFPEHLVDASVLETYEETIAIALTAGNTTLTANKIYTNTGALATSDTYSTLYLEIGKYSKFLLNNYVIGEFGGAFVKDDYSWISSFRTDGANANVPKIAPSNARFIGISAKNSDLYKTITGVYDASKYTLDNLVIKDLSSVPDNSFDPSKLLDYKSLGEIEIVDTIQLTAENTELLTNKVYSPTGGLADGGGTLSTLYFNFDNYTQFSVSNYVIGIYGGAFLREDRSWISSFRTDGTNASVPKIVPAGAKIIAISAKDSNLYQTISAVKVESRYTLKNLDASGGQNNIWQGKKVVWLGTSVPFGSNATTSYPYIASQRLGFDLVNTSVPGLAIHTKADGSKMDFGSSSLSIAEYTAQGSSIAAQPILPYVPGGGYNNHYVTWENIFTEENADADLWVFDVVPNNGNFSLTDWNLFDKVNWKYTDDSSFADHRTTFLGALLFLMDKMYTLNPKARMCFVLGSSFSYEYGKQNLIAVAEQWNIPIIDIWSKINTSPKSLINIKSKNGTDDHPSTFGHEILGNMITQELLSIS